MEKLKVAVIGAGCRGMIYTDFMLEMPDKYEVVAVAEPIEKRREHIRKKHNIPDDMCFDDWKPLLALGKISDAVLIATMDRDHFEPAMKAIELKYDLLLEKPISPIPEECVQIADAAEKNGVKVVICTVLRYTPLFMTLKEIIDSGQIGKVMSVNHEECVGNVHQSHSFVRGNWGNEERSSNMLLQKSCHDADILQWLLSKKLEKVQSFGSLSYFRRENAPEGAPEYCIEGCLVGETCPYNAVKIYLEDVGNLWGRDACTHSINSTDEEIEKAVRTSQYGKCVYKCDNNVVDHQTVNMLFEDNITVTFTMNAFNKGGRHIHIMGTEGEIFAQLDEAAEISLYDFETKETKIIPIDGKEGIVNGHGGGDAGIVSAFYDYMCGIYEGNSIPTIRESAINHLIAFAAEQSRKNNTVVDFDEYVKLLN